jgi:hypothetical protein
MLMGFDGHLERSDIWGKSSPITFKRLLAAGYGLAFDDAATPFTYMRDTTKFTSSNSNKTKNNSNNNNNNNSNMKACR